MHAHTLAYTSMQARTEAGKQARTNARTHARKI